MKLERLILTAFFGNYIINTIVAAVVSMIPPSQTQSMLTAQYISFVILAAIVSALFAYWYFRGAAVADGLKRGAIFGVGAFIVAILTTFISGTANVLMQSGSLSQVVAVIPNFGPFLLNWTTLVLLAYWVIPAALIGHWLSRKATTSQSY
ncbi:hypothetical protein FJY94_01370 [Candidatus Kaiserbacteria bacterium]|nr:hypothetical protein [Candidatus Kaiserbacteria bacterium]